MSAIWPRPVAQATADTRNGQDRSRWPRYSARATNVAKETNGYRRDRKGVARYPLCCSCLVLHHISPRITRTKMTSKMPHPAKVDVRPLRDVRFWSGREHNPKVIPSLQVPGNGGWRTPSTPQDQKSREKRGSSAGEQRALLTCVLLGEFCSHCECLEVGQRGRVEAS
jgi:hypothetical protein